LAFWLVIKASLRNRGLLRHMKRTEKAQTRRLKCRDAEKMQCVGSSMKLISTLSRKTASLAKKV